MDHDYPVWTDDMAHPVNRYERYAELSASGKTVLVRGSINQPWPKSGWPVSMAREFAAYINSLADLAEKYSPKVQELTADLESVSGNADEESWEDIAIKLARLGYHK